RVESREVSPIRRKLRPGISDDDLAFDHARRHRERVRSVTFGCSLDRPEDAPIFRIERNESAVICRNKDFSLVCGDAAIENTTTELIAPRFVDFVIDLRIVPPEFLAGTSIESESDAPVRDGVDDAID